METKEQLRLDPESQTLESYDPVEYIDHMGSDDRIADVARVSFDAWGTKADQNPRLIRYLAKHEHTSPFRHTSLTFRVHAPLYIARQMVKHQVGMSWNEISRRYVETDIKYHIAPVLRAAADNVKQGSSDEGALDQETSISVQRNMSNLHHLHYKHLLEMGVCAEQARAVLPLNLMTTWIWTGSLPAFVHMIRLRYESHAQRECWPIAVRVLDECLRLFPVSTEALLYGWEPPQ